MGIGVQIVCERCKMQKVKPVFRVTQRHGPHRLVKQVIGCFPEQVTGIENVVHKNLAHIDPPLYRAMKLRVHPGTLHAAIRQQGLPDVPVQVDHRYRVHVIDPVKVIFVVMLAKGEPDVHQNAIVFVMVIVHAIAGEMHIRGTRVG